MPEIQQDGLDVSAEEQRFLRRTFRRFALPYLIAMAAALLAVVYAMPKGPSAVDSTTAELEMLLAEAASVRESVAALREELREDGRKASARIDALEGGVAKLSEDLRAGRALRQARGPSPEVMDRLEESRDRIDALERRIGAMLERSISGVAPLANSRPPSAPSNPLAPATAPPRPTAPASALP